MNFFQDCALCSSLLRQSTACKMSLNEKEEKDVHTHETQPPEPSCVSVKSDACMRQPLNLSDRAVTSDPGASTNRKRKKKEEEEKAYASFYSTAYKMGRCVKREEEEDVHTHKAASPEPLPSDPDAKRADVIKSLSHQTRTVFETLMRQTVKDQHKTSMRNKYERLFEGIKLVENQTLLNRIYTELYIIEGESEEVNEEHEVLQMEKTTRTQYTSVNCNDIFKPLHEPGCEEKDQIKTVLTKGIAGIGKTVSVQKFILDWTEGKANQDIDFMFVLPFRELNLIKDHQYSLHRLLLDFHPELQDLTSETYEECKVVFIFDGLDESRITPMFTDDENVCDVNESSSVGVLMSNLIRGELLSSALIWITSRPAAANQIPSKYINRVTEIQGFNEHQKEKYFRKSIRDEHEASRVISHIKRSRSLHIMCHIPVFCWISATVLQNLLKQDHNAEIPQTLTEMYIHFLLTQINMRNQKYEERDPKTLQKTNRDVIVKLAELAFKQLMKGNVMFYEEDLIESGINVTDASVYSGICTEIFKEESVIHQRKVYCFIHLSFQEFLAAFFVFYSHVDKNDESLRLILKEINNWYSWQSSLSHSSSLVGIAPTYDAVAPCEPSSIPPPLSFPPLLPVIPPLPYQRKMKNSLYEVLNPIIAKSLQSKNGHLDLFLRFLLGVSLEFNQRLLSDLLTHTVNSSETIMTIRRYIRDTIKGAEHLSDRIRKSTECFTGLSDQIKPNIYDEHLSADRCINLFLCLLEMKDQTLYREIQEFVKSENHSVNRLSPSHCSTIAYILQISEVLDEFHLKKYNTSDEGRRRLIPAVVNCRKALFADCNLTGQCCKRLSSTLQSSNSLLRELDLSNNDLSDSSVKHLFDGMKSSHCQLNILRLSGCNLTGQCCESLSSSLQSSNSLKELDLSNNNLKDSGVKLLSDGMKSSYCQLNILRFDDCNLTGQCCESLSSYLQSSNTLRELDLSNNDLQDSGVMLLSDGLKSSHCQLNVLRLSGCMTGETLIFLLKRSYENISVLPLSSSHYNVQIQCRTVMLLLTHFFSCRQKRWIKDRHKTNMKNNYESLLEGIKLQENQTPLNKIYTQLYIIEGESEGENEEHIFHMEKPAKTEDIPINCMDIFKPLHKTVCEEKDKIKIVLTKGIAGIGKTVSVQKFILDWTEGKANQDVDFMFLLPFRELNLIKDHQYSLHRLLLYFHPELQDLDSKIYEECKVVFIFDGLDESKITLFSDRQKVCDVNESSSVGVLMSNLIRGELLPSALIWITSRPAAANQIPSKYINRVTEIQGFNEPQKEEYFRKRISDKHQAKRVISHIRKSKSLHIMCRIPVFCWISVTVLQNLLNKDDRAEIPQTLTEMYIHFLLTQINMRNQKYDERDPEKLQQSNREGVVKLAELAFKQLMKGNVMFYEEDLIESGIDVTDASVYSGICTEIFREESVIHQRKVYCFIHLSFQEFLAAFFVFYSHVDNNEKLLKVFMNERQEFSLCELLESLVNKSLHSVNGQLDLFLRFLLGVSLESNQRLLQDLLKHTVNSSEIINKITQYIKDKLKADERLSGDRYISLFLCLLEIKDQTLYREIQRFVKSENHSENKLSPAQCSTIAYMLLKSEMVLDEFDLKKFNTSDEGRRRLIPALLNCKKAVFIDCNLTDQFCESLSLYLQSSNSLLRELDLSHNDLQDSRVKLLSDGLKSSDCQLNILRLTDCNLTGQCCESLSSSLQSSSSLRELDLSHNDLQDSGVKLLSDGLKSLNCQLNVLRLSACMVTEEGCRYLASALSSNPSHLRELDLSYNHPGQSLVKLLSDPNYRLEKLNVDHGGEFRIVAGIQKYIYNLTLDLNTANTWHEDSALLGQLATLRPNESAHSRYRDCSGAHTEARSYCE
ncbi:hypothetical protein QQF64_010755 [Cirrhinus molitorella]|uniref:NACHT domain-containing protein n=1 Tax=Cirrhinus molitorella TaxID=172907 RepID=A0ABR3LXB0_9TELE